MIYTSYFGNLKKIQKYAPQIVPITICAKAPDWYKGLQYKKLAPKYEFFMEWKKNHDNDYYIREFNRQVLSKLTPKRVVDELYKMSKGEDVVLLCYEKPRDFCHRHLVSKWLTNSGYVSEEISIKEK